MNTLYYGDNLSVLREQIADESVDLIYLDPPFNSRRDYNLLFREASGQAPTSQIKAFGDSWQYTSETELAREEITHRALALGCPKMPALLDGIIDVLGHNDVTAYLVMMAIRLLELRRVLKPTGSFYLHCDPTASHYLKLLLDTVFGKENFRNEIVWKRSSAHNDTAQGRKQLGQIHDVIFYYTKSREWLWNPQYTAYDEKYIRDSYRHIEPETGRLYRLDNLTGPGGANKGNPSYEVLGVTRYWRYSRERMQQLMEEGRVVQSTPGTVPRYKRYLDEMPGVALQDVWTDLNPISSRAAERLGYPTQKPEALLERILLASSNEGEVVLDPFCGCGTTIAVAQRLGRQWLGIDVTHLAISLIESRLRSQHDLLPGRDYEVVGTPADLTSARDLFARDAYQFQFWALSLIPAFPAGGEKKKGADKGIDGEIRFVDDDARRSRQIIVQVKGGHVTANQIRDLRGTIEREKAALGFFVCLENPTAPMRTEAAAAGVHHSELWHRSYPRLQIRTIEELLSGHGFEYPAHAAGQWKQAVRSAPASSSQQAMEL